MKINKAMVILALFLIFMSITPSVDANPSAEIKEWSKIFGGSKDDRGYSVQQTSDGGYIIVGSTESYGAGGDDVWLIKTDSKGNKEWEKTFGESYSDGGYSVQQTSDGGYIITGYTCKSSVIGIKSTIWLIKTDSEGNKEWDNRDFPIILGGDPRGFAVQQTSDGGYIIVGSTNVWSISSTGGNVWLIKTDSQGNEEWDVFLRDQVTQSSKRLMVDILLQVVRA